MQTLQTKLARIDGKGYKAYKDLAGEYTLPQFKLFIDHVQADPFAAPSRLRIRVSQDIANIPQHLFSNNDRLVALKDQLTRLFHASIRKRGSSRQGTGKSGLIAIDTPGQEVLDRTAITVNQDYLEARIVMGLPAQGRRVLGKQAHRMLLADLPSLVEESLIYANLDQQLLENALELAEDQAAIEKQIAQRELICFVANGSILPRQSGVSDLPLRGNQVVAFESPPELEVTMTLPHRGVVKGMGIPQGVTLIVGGGYHGKSTLLRAIERGIYRHVAGDGRELVVTRHEAVKIRAEDGRSACQVDISPFIKDLPHGQDTKTFSSENTSGSTSQATNIAESLELGANVLLIDEDTSATNFMIRDARMQQLISEEKEPITPFIDTVGVLRDQHGISTVLVLGGSGDYFDVADTIISMEEYVPRDVTDEARRIAIRYPTKRKQQIAAKFNLGRRIPLPAGFDASKGRKTKVDSKGLHRILFGTTQIDLDYVEQLVDPSQTRAIAACIFYLEKKYVDGRRDLATILGLVTQDIAKGGLETISPYFPKHPGDYAMVRPFEIAAAINRMRTLQMK